MIPNIPSQISKECKEVLSQLHSENSLKIILANAYGQQIKDILPKLKLSIIDISKYILHLNKSLESDEGWMKFLNQLLSDSSILDKALSIWNIPSTINKEDQIPFCVGHVAQKGLQSAFDVLKKSGSSKGIQKHGIMVVIQLIN